MTNLSSPDLDPSRFDGEVGGRRVRLLPLSGPGGLRAAVCTQGGRLLQLVVPGRGGAWHDVVLGPDSLPQLLAGLPSMGAFIGRHANRIAHARLTIDGSEWQLPANDGPHCLHGGPAGSRFQVFDVVEHGSAHATLAWTFRQAEDGFPGDLALQVTWRLREAGVLAIEWRARALDRDTVASFTPHPFFNLDGAHAPHVRDQHVAVEADHYLPVDAGRIPTGEIAPVDGTPFDLRHGPTVGQALERAGFGLDHCWVPAGAPALRRLARAWSPASGVAMEVWGDAPGLQFYTASGLDGSLPRHAGKGGRAYGPEAGFCLEPQGLPDAPNQPHFPSALVREGQERTGVVEYRFSVRD